MLLNSENLVNPDSDIFVKNSQRVNNPVKYMTLL